MKRKLFYFLKLYFGFSRRESRGFLFVFPLLLLLYSVPVIYSKMLKYTNQDDYQAYLDQVDKIIAAGLPNKDSLNKEISLLERVYPGQDSLIKVQIYSKVQEPKLNVIDFAEADSIVLQVVPGIGKVLAGRIIKYRESLGGLHQQQQLLEVYGLTEEVVSRIFEFFHFSPVIHQKLPINKLDAGQLAEHPYISFGQAKVIVAYRGQHGNYKEAGDLLKIKIFNEEWLERLKPYLEF